MTDTSTIGAAAGRAANRKPMIPPPVILPLPLSEDQYVKQKTAKTHIILHHTAGSTAAGAMAGWKATPQKIATSFIIDRDGSTFEAFSPDYWASHLGVKGHSWLEKCSIGIEIVAWGHLTQKVKGGRYLSYTGKEVPPGEVVQIDGGARNSSTPTLGRKSWPLNPCSSI
jgi:N-acetyl-anhydromuramyl-L-alanine amidase AmpD